MVHVKRPRFGDAEMLARYLADRITRAHGTEITYPEVAEIVSDDEDVAEFIRHRYRPRHLAIWNSPHTTHAQKSLAENDMLRVAASEVDLIARRVHTLAISAIISVTWTDKMLADRLHVPEETPDTVHVSIGPTGDIVDEYIFDKHRDGLLFDPFVAFTGDDDQTLDPDGE